METEIATRVFLIHFKVTAVGLRVDGNLFPIYHYLLTFPAKAKESVSKQKQYITECLTVITDMKFVVARS